MLYKEKLTKLPQKTSNGLIHYKQHLYTVVNNKIDKLSKRIAELNKGCIVRFLSGISRNDRRQTGHVEC